MGSWTEEESRLIDGWIKEDGFEEKRAIASNLISDMIAILLKEDCGKNGRIKSKRLGELLQHLEDLLATTKGGMAKKFYRDHLNHMLRVMLLSNAISKSIRSFSLSTDEAKLVTLAGLVHDIAYPLSESYQILNETIKAMRRCYGTLTFPDFLVSYDMERVMKLLETLGLKDYSLTFFGPFLRDYNHGLMGAIEFSDYVSPDKLQKYVRLLKAIVFHDPLLEPPAKLKEDPILQALVLSDEIQDWGRPAGLEREPAISEITDFKIGSDAIQGTFEWKNSTNASPLRQIHSKASNFRRLVWPSSFKAMFTFRLPYYNLFDARVFERLVKDLVEYCQQKHPDIIPDFNQLWKEGKELFRSYYGNTLPQTDDLIRHFLQQDASGMQQGSIYFAGERREILHTNKALGKLVSITLEIRAGDVSLSLRGEEQHVGYLCPQSDDKAQQLVKTIATRLILFNELASRLASKSTASLKTRYFFPSYELIERAMREIGYEGNISSLVESIRDLRRSFVENGFFSFRVV